MLGDSDAIAERAKERERGRELRFNYAVRAAAHGAGTFQARTERARERESERHKRVLREGAAASAVTCDVVGTTVCTAAGCRPAHHQKMLRSAIAHVDSCLSD